ncbi:lysozyme inhibitor LprI family protein [Burkholderia sp. Bp9142]|uniref:lysozyme inhibitor LprI family protein n=1 Tax=Burkholderia sp. Bp9142 TaxID=2184573 RepID=UPI000F598F7E|nr:hypothetical protein [Burkholderia sp. Bp9142]
MANEKSKKGFAGLESMASDVTTLPIPPTSPPSPERSDTLQAGESAPIYAGALQPTSGPNGSAKWWAIGIGLLVLFALLLNSHTPSQSPPVQGIEANQTSSSGFETPNSSLSATSEQTIASNEENVPPAGKGLILDRSQIRYCLSQKIRLEAWDGQVIQTSEISVNAFNVAIADYNSRCSNFRYYVSEFERVRAEVEVNRAALTQQGFSKAAAANQYDANLQNAPAIKTSFDCAKARSDAEHLICSDAQLAAEDVELASLFAHAKAVVRDRVAFREHARQQWNYRERNCHDRLCLGQWYAGQRQWLTTVVESQGMMNAPGEND